MLASSTGNTDGIMIDEALLVVLIDIKFVFTAYQEDQD